MSTEQVVRSTCGMCRCACGVLLYVKDGSVTKVEGDPDSPINRGTLCPVGSAALEYLRSPDRLQHPLKRVGERGEGKWQRVSWDEALDVVADKLNKAKDNYGAESVVIIRSAARGLPDDYIVRFANAFGTPNVASPMSVCHVPTVMASAVTYGGYRLPDYEYGPACLVLWGINAQNTDVSKYLATNQALEKGSKLIVVNPVQIDFAKKADIWLRLRPGSDLALALGMINVIINEGLYDKAFVDNWTEGFDELKAHVQEYTPEKVAEITWLDAEKIRETARFYATNRPASIDRGNGIEHNLSNFQTARAICILQAITGNLEIPGGDVEIKTSPGMVPRSSPELTLHARILLDKRKRWLSSECGLIQMVSPTLSQSIVKSILEGDPYTLRAAFIQGSNVLVGWGDSQETYKALKKLDFLVVSDLFMTPTASMADIVLPAATYLEYDSIGMSPNRQVVQVQQKVAEVGECWSDYKIVGELAKKLGLGEFFWDEEEDFLNDVLKKTGIKFKELRQIVVFPSVQRYRNYEADGFKTPSKKVELYSKRLEEWGFDPLPVYHEQPETPYSDPELAKEYPLVLTTSKSAYFIHTSGRQIGSLRKSHPNPVVDIHPDTAGKLGIKEGDWVHIETKRGNIKQKARLTAAMDPRVVRADFGWWFPERDAESLHGWAESSINILPNSKPPYGREMGTPNLRGFLCKISKA